VPNGNPDQIVDMLVIKDVVHHLSFLTVIYEPKIFEHSQLVGNCGFGHREEGSDIADAEFLTGERKNNAQPGWIAQDFERVAQVAGGSGVVESLSGEPYLVLVDIGNFAFSV
jgi:hypothetical protein